MDGGRASLGTIGMSSPRDAQDDRHGPASDALDGSRAGIPSRVHLARDVDQARTRTRDYLLECQHGDGYWCGELEGDTILESEYILLLAFLNNEDTPTAQKAARYLIHKQLPGGGWAMFPGGNLDISGSVKAYFALKLTGHSPDAEYMQRARKAILAHGGADRVNSFTRFYLAMLGQISYDFCPAVPPEVVLLPTWFPVNIFRVSAWTRTILVPLSIIWAHRPVRELSDKLGIGELFTSPPDRWPSPRCAGLEKSRKWFSWERLFRTIDFAIKQCEQRGLRPLRRRALRVAESWLVKHFVGSDGLGAIFPPMIWSVVALRCLEYSDDSLEVRYCHEMLQGLILEQDDMLRIQPCKSPVWDTAITLRALALTDWNSKDSCVRRAISWLLHKEITRPGDWAQSVKTAPGGWCFEHHNDFYPDINDTAMVLMALAEQFADSQLDDSTAPSGVSFIAADRVAGVAEAREQMAVLERAAAACDRGRRWVLAMQNRDGGWGSFDKDNDSHYLCYVPFADHNAMIDPSTPDITGRVLEMLGKLGAGWSHHNVQSAIEYMRASQQPNGSWFGRWGVNYVYGTSQALIGLSQVGVQPDDPAIAAGASWLLEHQHPGGAWGESPGSYDNPTQSGNGPPTASQTAWALLGLMAAGYRNHPAVQRGIQYLVDTQSPDGSWDEPEFTGTGFPRVFYLRYHMYPIYFPLMALATWQRAER